MSIEVIEVIETALGFENRDHGYCLVLDTDSGIMDWKGLGHAPNMTPYGKDVRLLLTAAFNAGRDRGNNPPPVGYLTHVHEVLEAEVDRLGCLIHGPNWVKSRK